MTTNVLTIKEGPFKGTSFDASQTYYAAGMGLDGLEVIRVQLAALNQAFLAVYPPSDGWAVTIDAEMIPVDMFPLHAEGGVGAVPCARFDAKLVDPSGRAVCSASTVWTIKGPTEWEKGESNARIRLYEAAGLQSKFNDRAEAGSRESHADKRPVVLRESALPLALPETATVAVIPEEVEVKTKAVQKEAVAVVTEAAAPAKVSNKPTKATVTPLVLKARETSADTASASTGTRKKRERSPDDGPPTQAIVNQIERLCRFKGMAMPEIKTKAEANEFLKTLTGG